MASSHGTLYGPIYIPQRDAHFQLEQVTNLSIYYEQCNVSMGSQMQPLFFICYSLLRFSCLAVDTLK